MDQLFLFLTGPARTVKSTAIKAAEDRIGCIGIWREDVLLSRLLECSPPVYQKLNEWNGVEHTFLSSMKTDS
jgi:hypothetical protein